jgi:hypothetical protein
VLVAIETKHRAGGARGKSEQQIGIAVGVEIAPRRPRRPCVGNSHLLCDILEGGTGGRACRGVAIQAVRGSVEPDEEIGIAVGVIVGPGVDEGATQTKELRLHRLEPERLQ